MSQLIIFLGFFLSIYGAMHLYLLVKIRRAFYMHGWKYLFIVVVLLGLMLAPIQANILERLDYHILSLIITWIGFVWMGFVLILICVAVPIDIYHLGLALAQHIYDTDWTHLMLSRRSNLGFAVFLTLIIMGYGAFEAQQIHIEKVTIHSEKISKVLRQLRIVQISDLHLGPMTPPGRLAKIVSQIKKCKPDLLVSTGDLVDGYQHNAVTAARMLADIQAPMGKFAVTGNHEAYMGLEQALKFHYMAGFTVLRNQGTNVDNALNIAGVDDPAITKSALTEDAKILATLPSDQFTLLLKHRPVVDLDALGLFDIQLSGHTHSGQIFPFSFMVQLSYPKLFGFHILSKQSRLYINRGIGTWGPPIRLLARPEITIVDLIAAGSGVK